MSKKYLLLLTSLMLLVTTGCFWQGVAYVNDEKITQQEFELRFNKMKAVYELQGTNFESAISKKLLPGLKQEVLEDLIREKLVLQEAQRRGINVTPKDVDALLSKVKADFNSEADYQRSLKLQHINEGDLKNYLYAQAVKARLEKELVNSVTVTSDQVYQEFISQPSMFTAVKVQRILVDSETKALELISLLQQGSDFTYLAKKYSIELGANETGGEQEFTYQGQMVPEEEKLAFTLPVGQVYAKPISTVSGYSILKVLARKETFAAVEKDIRHSLLERKKAEVYESFLKKLEEKAQIRQIDKFMVDK